ncbi:helix-turn-helix transcriptional regulator [Nocardioides deserti]|uniref:helix-turn-helix transcriptional regulator n=1 Tax=Nocardioides deserti TaxID=1588644 RepID=UPI001989B86A|nr:WYL domain-containing protein [Nocardioides deserti]GGO75396.1 DeoR family transcriptional regulator [Nocardioides deserti]
MSTTGRLLSLLSLLQARRDWPGPALARRLEVSERTVRRDVERLRDLGYRIETARGPDGGYRLGAGPDLPPLLLDDGQAVALAVALQTATASGAAVADDAARALATVRQVMPSRLRHRVDAVQVSTVGRPSGDAADPAVIAVLTTAVRDREVLRFDHRPVDAGADGPRDPDAPPRRVEPHHVVTRAGRWYLVGFDLDRDDWRVFRVDRIAPRTPTGPRFTPRDLPGDADVATYLTGRLRGSTGSAGDWPCRGEVVLALPAAEVVPFASDGMVEALGPDRCRLVVGSWSWAGLVALVTRFGADFEVVGPRELRDEVRRTAERLSRAGARAGPPSPT